MNEIKKKHHINLLNLLEPPYYYNLQRNANTTHTQHSNLTAPDRPRTVQVV